MIQVDDSYVGIGGGGIAAIVGVDEFKTALDVWRELRGDEPRTIDPPSEAAWCGQMLESAVAEMYKEKSGHRLRGDGRERFAHEARPWQTGRPDRQVVTKGGGGELFGLEIKTTDKDNAPLWGAQGSADVPDRVATQCHWYMSLTGFPRWDVAVLIGGNDFRTYSLKANAKIEQLLLRKAHAFWEDHVKGNAPPEARGEVDELREALKKTSNRVIEPDDANVYLCMRALISSKETVSSAKAMEDRYRDRLAELLVKHDARGFKLPDGSTFRLIDVQPRVKYKQLALHLLNKYEVDYAHRLELTLKFSTERATQLRLHVANVVERDDEGGEADGD